MCKHTNYIEEELCWNGGQPDEQWIKTLICLDCDAQGTQTDEGIIWISSN